MKRKHINQKGVTFVTAVFTLLLFSILGMAFASLIRREAFNISYYVGDEQLVFLADSGTEIALNWFYQYDNTKFYWWDNADSSDKSILQPNYQNISLAGGKINISTQYAGTVLEADLMTDDTTVVVNSTAGFPDSGIILINAEWIKYSAKTDTEFLNCIRGYDVSEPDTHQKGAFVYPECKLTSSITATQTTIPVDSTEKFLPEGTIFIGNEAITYKSKTANSFEQCERGKFGTNAENHNESEKVIPAPFEAFITSTAEKDGRKKTVEILIQYQYGNKWE